MLYFIDSNIFLRALHKENRKFFLDCVRLLKNIKENRIKAYTSTVVLAEVVWTLQSFYGIEKDKIISGLKGITSLNGLKITDNYNNVLALDIWQKHSVKFIDALIASDPAVQDKSASIISYDRDFDKLKVVRHEPKDILKNLPIRN